MNTACVNRSSKAFKSLAKKLDISENQLEVLAHEYNMLVGSADGAAFLTDAGQTWLKEFLSGKVVNVGQYTYDMWKEQYSKPLLFNTLSEVTAAYNEATRYFPKDSVVLKETNAGKYELRVANVTTAPVNERASRQDIIRRNGIQSIEDIFGNDLFGVKKSITLNEAITALSSNTKITPLVELLKFLQERTPDVTIVRKDTVLNHGVEVDGLYDGDKTIYISENSTKPVGQVLAHELLHPMLLDKLNSNDDVRQSLDRIINKANDVLGDKAALLYGLESPEEFLSEILTEGKLITALSEIEGIDADKKAQGLLSQIREWFRNCLKLIFGDKATLLDNALYEVERLINDSIVQYDVDTFNAEQNKIKDLVKRRSKEYGGGAYSDVLDALKATAAEYPYMFQDGAVLKDFIVDNKKGNGSYVAYELNGKHLFNNRVTANARKREYLRNLRNRQWASQADNTTFLQEQQKFYNQLQAIQQSGRLSSTEVREVGQDVAYAVSDLITAFQDGTMDLTVFTGKETTKEVSQMSRAEILQFIGVDNAFEYVNNQYFGNLNGVKTPKDRLAATTIYKNFDAIKELAAEEFVNVEGFGLKFTQGKETDVVEDLHINVEDLGGEDVSDVLEREGDLQEHWQVNIRTLDILGSMSQLVRQGLLKCYQLDKEGNPIVSRFGIAKRVPARTATSQILRWGQGAIDLPHMLDQLRAHVDDNPWITQIIQRLEHEGKTEAEYGADTDFRSQFWSVFNKHFQSYTVGVRNKDGHWYSDVVNERPALRDLIKQLQVYTSMGQVPMFTSDGINPRSLANLHQGVESLLNVTESEFNQLSDEAASDLRDAIWYSLMELGVNLTEDELTQNWTYPNYVAAKSALFHIDNTLTKNKDNKNYDPFEFQGGIKGNLQEAIAPFITDLEDIAMSSVHQDGKSWQSYITPSYLTKFMQKMKLRGEEFDKFIEDEFGQYDWFKNENGWRNPWIRAIVEKGDRGYKVNGIDYRDILAHHVQLNFNKKSYMRQMNSSEYALSVMTEYFQYLGKSKDPVSLAWYRVPMLSNKPSSEFIRFICYADLNTYKDNVLNDIMDVFFQELSRIQTTKERNKKYDKKSPEYIKNLDKNGLKFNFLPYLNSVSGTFKTLVERKTNGDILTVAEEAQLNTEARREIQKHMQERAERILNEWEQNGLMEAATSIEGLNSANVRAQLENFIWNDNLATMMIEQLFVTDIALYKDTEDLQKRMAQIHAPGVRGEVHAVDYDGKPVSDGTYRTVLLTDFDDFVSNIIENLQEVFVRQEENMVGGSREATKAVHAAIIDAFKEINVADAQGYSSPTSRRKKDFIMGTWSRDKESIYKRLVDGNYTVEDLKKVFDIHTMSNEVEKPFCYSQIGKDTGVEHGMKRYKLGVQFKNSEYLLVMADAILQNERTGRPNLLRAIYRFMEDSAKQNPLRGIDTIQFESTAKALVQGRVNIHQFQDVQGGETLAYNELNKMVYNEDGSYNLTTVHEVPFEDWCLQQPVPNHFYDHAQAQGSQTRMIIPSSLERMWNGEEVKFKVYDDSYSADEFRTVYENTIAQNIQESLNAVSEELGLNTTDRLARNVAIARVLQREIKSSPRYGTDLLKACTLDANGEFMIPLGDPIQSKRIEQLLNSIIKNRVNKQEIAGGPVVQVSNFGTSRALNIRFNDKNGGLLATKDEFAQEASHRGLSGKSLDKAYADYIRQNQAGIAYYEVFAPRFEGIEAFEDKWGNINMEAIEKECPEILDMICYRIPTEDKYSITPCKIVGFLPKEAGAGIMMPNEITTLTGSDFDVDKMYCMRKEFVVEGVGKNRKITVPHSMDTRVGRNNRIVEMTRSVLTHESNASKVLNPGGFEPQKRMGYMVEAYRHGAASWDVLESIADGKTQIKSNGDGTFQFSPTNTEDIKSGSAETGVGALKSLSYQSSDLGFIDTQVQFYKQNSAAGSILAIFAVAKVAHAVLEDNQLRIILNNPPTDGGIGLTAPLSIAGFKIGSADEMTADIDPIKDANGELIGKTLGSLVASAADAVKAPVLNLMNVNQETVNVLNTLVRFGMPFDDAALFLSQKVIGDVLQDYYKESLSKNVRLQDIVEQRLKDMGNPGREVAEDIRKEKLIEGIASTTDAKHVKQVLYAFDKALAISNALRGVNFATRFNSVSSAVGPLIIDNIIKESRKKPSNFSQIYGLGSEGIAGVFALHPILEKFAQTLNTAEILFNDMPEYSQYFRKALEQGSLSTVPRDFSSRVLDNRSLAGKYSDFFKSCLVLASGIVKEGELNHYINEFPVEFAKLKQDEKYKDNPLMKHLKVAKDKDGTLYIKTDDGVLNDISVKEDLMAAWTDLLTDNKTLAIDLFKYCFFKGGIGFSPRTFMAFVPVELKLAINGYKEAFRNADTTFDNYFDSENRSFNVADLFVQNNWRDNYLVPEIKEDNIQITPIKDSHDIKVLASECKLPYFKIKADDGYIIYKRVTDTQDRFGAYQYTPLQTLGGNGEYIELHAGEDSKYQRIVKSATAQVLNTTIEMTDDTMSSEEVVGVDGLADTNTQVAEINDAIVEEQRAKAATEALGISPVQTESVISDVTSAVSEKVPAVTEATVKETMDKQNNC